jgi:hypothetical protein
VLADHRPIDAGRTDAEALAQMHTKTQAVEIGARAEHPVVSGKTACDVDQWFRRVRGDEDYCRGSSLHQPRHNVLEHLDVEPQQAQPTGWVVAVRCAAAF